MLTWLKVDLSFCLPFLLARAFASAAAAAAMAADAFLAAGFFTLGGTFLNPPYIIKDWMKTLEAITNKTVDSIWETEQHKHHA